MKKIYALSLLCLMLFCMTANAQERRTVWDFRKGFSEETIGNFISAADAGAGWGNNYDAETKIGYFNSKARTAGALVLNVNGQDWVVPETEGLTFGAVSAEHLNIVMGEKNLGPHIWFNGKKAEDYVQVEEPIQPQEEVVVVYSSHKNSEARGFKVSGNFKDANGKQSWTVSTRAGVEEVPDKYLDTIVVINTGEEAAKLKLSATNGAHIHLISIGGFPQDGSQNNVAYLFDSTYPDYDPMDDYVPDVLANNIKEKVSDFELTKLDLSVEPITRDQLLAYKAVILGPIKADNQYVPLLKEVISYTPILDLSANLYEAWGYGKAVQTESSTIQVAAKYLDSDLFKNDLGQSLLAEDGTYQLLAESVMKAYELSEGSLFAGDEVIATAEDKPVMHIHTIGKNAYMLLPLEFGTFFNEDADATSVLCNFYEAVASTKGKVTKTAKPQVVQSYKHMVTDVKLTCATGHSSIYYTTDGTEPTAESTLYQGETFTFTEPVTFKVVAFAEGYNASDVNTTTVKVNALKPTPEIACTVENDTALVTITCPEENVTIYYNFTGDHLAEYSAIYKSEFKLAENATVSAFVAEQGDTLASEVAKLDVVIPNRPVRTKLLSKMNGSSATLPANAKSGFNYYDYSAEPVDTIINDELVSVYPKADSVLVFPIEGIWNARTKGQPFDKLNATPGFAIHDVTGYNPYSVFDAINAKSEINNNALQMASVNMTDPNGNKEPASAEIYTTEALQAPFDVIVYASGKNTRADILVASDTTETAEWINIGQVLGGTEDLMDGSKDASNRIWRRTKVSYNQSGEVFIRIASGGNLCNLFNVVVYGSDVEEAINETRQQRELGNAIRTEVYSLNGMRLSNSARGLILVKTVYDNGTTSTRKVMR